jgi:hypothetical protein
MLLRTVTIIGLAAPHVLYVTWLATAFSSVNEIMNNSLAKGFFLEMAAATALLTLFLRANPLGKSSLKWFVLFSMIGGVGMGLAAFYWLNKRSSVMKKHLRATKREIVKVKNEQKEKLVTASESMRTSPSLILSGRSA